MKGAFIVVFALVCTVVSANNAQHQNLCNACETYAASFQSADGNLVSFICGVIGNWEDPLSALSCSYDGQVFNLGLLDLQSALAYYDPNTAYIFIHN